MKKLLSKKLNIFKSSPLISVVAIIEVVLLVCVSTFAWFVYAENNQINTDLISVEPDSGLEIDFNDANDEDYINIWNYLNEFQFEPVTSLDGRNIFVPTTGTFNAYAGDVSPDTPSSPENPGDTQNTYLIYFDTKGTGWGNTPYIECDFTYHEDDNIAMTRLNSESTIYYYDLAPLLNKYNYKLTYMKFKNGKGGNGVANITNMFGTKFNCIYPTLSANYLYKCKLDSNDKAIQGEQANHHGLMVLEPEPYSVTVPDIGGGGTGNSGSGEGSGAVADKGGIKFREATVNDMNSKYINIDFTLTNTGEEEMPVYLSSKSFFKLYDPVTEEEVNSKAIRIAFYQNDGSSGKVTSSLLSQEYEGEEPTEPPTVVEPTEGPGDTQANFLIYFNVTGSSWDQVWIETDHTATLPGNSNRCFKMKPHPTEENIYYIDLKTLITDIDDSILTFIKFRRDPNSNDSNDTSVQLPKHDIYHNYLYEFKLNLSGKAYAGDFNGGYGMLLDETPTTYTGPAPDIGGDEPGTNGPTESPTEAPTTPDEEGKITVYFNNTLGWNPPYAYIWQSNDRSTKDDDVALSAWPGKPMNHISGSIYYYTFNAKYDSIIFNDGNSQGGAVKTGDIYPVKDGHIYMIGNPNPDNTLSWEVEDYVGAVDGGTYPVISPGASTGFQRPYAPVIEIDNNSGSSKVVIPAFASSIDDYNYGSNNSLFTIKAGQTMSLSMIVWLEGTDPDCTEDVYAGKDIDMNLIFATKDSGEEMYKYQFLDKTRENWIDDKVTTDTGVSFNPVIQLYDVDNQKGYMMSVHDDEEGKPTIWQCIAPAYLIDSEHIMFRRVNPMNEDEVWNYWDTDGFAGTDAAVETTNAEGEKLTTVYFSAFSDGAPTVVKNENGTDYKGVPSKSCGGLWGNHEVHTVTVYDGTKDQWIKNSDLDGSTSVLTMNYQYKYQNGKTHTVEYKASGAADKGLYYFVVPYEVYSKNGSNHNEITFKRYYNFYGDYALNSDKNQLTYHMSWKNGACKGKFFQINGNESNGCYWGSDMLYVQTRAILNGKIDNSYLQAHFSNSSGSDSYIPLNRNDYYAAKNDGYGFACVIPADKAYTAYTIERCDPDNHYTVWNATPKQDISNSTSTDFNYSNTIDSNICTIDYMFLKVYLECSTSYCGDKWDPEIYLFKGDAKEKDWPGNTMTWSSSTPEGGGSGYNQYVYDVNISKYDTMIFSNDYDYGNQRRQTRDIPIGTDDHVSGMIYQWDASNQKWRSTHKSGVTANETLHVTLYNTQWDQNS